ncbi:MAG: hypothetical protein ABJ246_13430 [Paracoccaceae bacterium]
MRLTALSLTLCLLASTSYASPLVGKWNCAHDGESERDKFYVVGTMDFRKNGTLRIKGTATGVLPDGSAAQISIKSRGKWKLENGKLFEQNYRNTVITRLVIDGIDQTRTQLRKEFQEGIAKSLAEDDSPSDIVFQSPNRFSLVDDGIDSVCERIGAIPTS